MNSLGRDIKRGDTVVMKQEVYPAHFDLRFICISGEGMSKDAGGTLLEGYWEHLYEESRNLNAMSIDAVCTRLYEAYVEQQMLHGEDV